MRLPTFVVIGAMKAGTTSLYHYLRAHPQVVMADRKELDFFADDDRFALGVDWYRQQFADRPGAVAVGEASPAYTAFPAHPDCAARLTATLPEARLVYVVRDPLERIESHYRHAVVMGGERRPLEEVVEADPSYLDISRYGLQLEQYLAQVDAGRILVVDSTDLDLRRVEAMAEIAAFLGITPRWPAGSLDQRHYRSADRRAVRAGVRRLTSLPAVAAVGRRLPTSIKVGVARAPVLSRPARRAGITDVSLAPAARRDLARRLAPDLERFCERLGRGFDHWPTVAEAGR